MTSTKPIYRQSGVIPYRIKDGSFQILLITSLKKRRWIIPKGIIEPGLSAAESALKEAIEEAGASGTISRKSVCNFHYEKWGGRCEVEVYLLNVGELAREWEEMHLRKRKWFSLKSARKLIREEPVVSVLERFDRVVRLQFPGSIE